MNITVVTNSFQRSKELVERSLRASLTQISKPYWVICIDQNRPVLQLDPEILARNNFEHLEIHTRCVSVARNSFKIPEKTDWLIFCDDDGYLKDDYISKLLIAISESPGVEIFAGGIVRDDNGEFYSPRHKIGGDLNLFRHSKLLMGSNFCVRAETFKRLQGFDERFGAGSYWGSGEETDFAWKALFLGIPMEYRRELLVYHVKPYAGSLVYSIKKGYRYGVGKGALVAKWLVFNRKISVVYELAEMLVIPLIQMGRDIFRFQAQNTLIYLGVLGGRLFGFFKFLIVGK